MKVTGYGCEAEWDGSTLVARGTNKVSHMAIAGPGHKGDVVIPADQIATATLKAAGALTNGNLTITTTDGQKYALNFQKKSAADFEALKSELPLFSAAAEAVEAVTMSDHLPAPAVSPSTEVPAAQKKGFWASVNEAAAEHANDCAFEGVRVSGRNFTHKGKARPLAGAVADFEHGANVGSRVTLTRVALTGIFALGLKKSKNKVYVLIESADREQILVEAKAKQEKDARKFVAKFNAAVAAAEATQGSDEPSSDPTALAAPASHDAVDQLKKLADLHAAGVLTDEEFAAKKADLLDRL